jgi:hypothetical protein
VLELDVCTDWLLVVTDGGRPVLNTLAAGLLNRLPPVAAVLVPDGPAGMVPAGAVPPDGAAGAGGGGPGAVEPGAGAERGVIETVVVVLRLLAFEALLEVPAAAPPVCPGWL